LHIVSIMIRKAEKMDATENNNLNNPEDVAGQEEQNVLNGGDADSIEKYIEQKKLQNRILKEILEKISHSNKD